MAEFRVQNTAEFWVGRIWQNSGCRIWQNSGSAEYGRIQGAEYGRILGWQNMAEFRAGRLKSLNMA